jgi:hypothetical protein
MNRPNTVYNDSDNSIFLLNVACIMCYVKLFQDTSYRDRGPTDTVIHYKPNLG